MKGDLLFVKNYTWIGNRIRIATNSDFNHVGIFITDDEIVEATFSGVKKSSIDKFKKLKEENKLDYDIYYWNEDIPKYIIEELIKKIEKEIGSGYDFWQLLSQGVFLLFHISRLVEPIEIDRRWICSELIGELSYELGIKFNENVDPDNITPEDILKSGLIKKRNIDI